MFESRKCMPCLTLFLLLGCSALTYGSKTLNTTKFVGIAAALTVGTASAIWYACQTEKPEDLIKQVDSIDKALLKHLDIGLDKLFAAIYLVTKNCPYTSISYWNEFNTYIQLLTEADLNTYMIKSCITAAESSKLHKRLPASIAKVSSLFEKLRKAIRYEKNNKTRLELVKALLALESVEFKLTFLEKLFALHRAYFELYDLSEKLTVEYAKELSAISCPIIHAGSCYTSLAAVKKLANAIENLKKLVHGESSQQYQMLAAEANLLTFSLMLVYKNMLADPRYATDLKNEELRWEHWCSDRHDCHYPKIVAVDIPVTKHAEQTKTKMDKTATITRSTWLFDPAFSHPAAVL